MLSYMNRGAAFYKGVGRLALPLILQNLVTSSLGLVDTFMVGALPGDAPMAAVTLANIPIFVILLMTFGLQSGASVLISQFWGKRDTDAINRVLGIGLYLGGAFTALFAIVMMFFPVPFIGLFSNNTELVLLAAEYARPAGLSCLFACLSEIYIAAHRSMENPKLGLYILSIAMLVNTFLNWVFIFGNLGAPALGVEGAALATLYSRVLQFVILLAYALRSKRFPVKVRLLLRPGRELLRKYIRFSTPVLLNETLWGLGTALYPTIMGYMAGSTEILAAYAVSGNLEKICTVAVFAVAGTAAIVVGREIGAGRPHDEVYQIGKALNTLAFLLGLVVGLLVIAATLFILAPMIYPHFGLTVKAQSISSMMLILTSAFLSVRSFNSTNIVGVLRGGGDVRSSTIIDLTPLWLFALPLSALCGLVLQLDIFVVCLCINLENVLKFFLGVHRFKSHLWINDVTQLSYQKNKD